MTASHFLAAAAPRAIFLPPSDRHATAYTESGVRNKPTDSDVPSPTESLVTATRSGERYKLTMVCATREPGFQI
jgi:hypothetical protein